MWNWVRAGAQLIVNTADYGQVADLSTAVPEIVKAL